MKNSNTPGWDCHRCKIWSFRAQNHTLPLYMLDTTTYGKKTRHAHVPSLGKPYAVVSIFMSQYIRSISVFISLVGYGTRSPQCLRIILIALFIRCRRLSSRSYEVREQSGVVIVMKRVYTPPTVTIEKPPCPLFGPPNRRLR